MMYTEKKARSYKMKITDGNDAFFSIENTERLPDNVLTGKTFFFLGSSVTCGAGAHGEGMGEFIAKRNGSTCIREAVSGTTLADTDETSYVHRFEAYLASDKKANHVDAFVCQLSTNDRRNPDNFGVITPDDVKDITKLDKTTTFGAMEYIIALARQTWNCPVVFYTGTWFESKEYEDMISALNQIAKKWNVTVLDMFYDKEFNDLPKETYELYMLDPVHPKRAGYRDWWTPAFETCIKSVL